jgi:hypothetical protein
VVLAADHECAAGATTNRDEDDRYATPFALARSDGVMLDAPHRAQARRIMTSFEHG